VTLESLLTFIGILVAVLAIVRPVQRRSLVLFVPLWGLGAAILLSLVLVICRDAPLGIPPPFGWPLSRVLFGLTLGAFLIPVGAALWSWACWQRAKLAGEKIRGIEAVFQAALREREFDEVERILRQNQQSLEQLPASAASVLFDEAMVAALIGSHSLVHLELLSHLPFLNSLRDRFGPVDVVTRELLRSEVSPLRSAVVSHYGGWEHHPYSESEKALVEATFQNPEWYVAASAHYPLVIYSVEMLRNGKLDSAYNEVGRDYEATQGISGRVRCPVYLATKTEVLAIDSALREGVEEDFYVTDLWNIFTSVQERSEFVEHIWQSPLANDEHPTPYAYLLYELSSDLEDLSSTALETATNRSPRSKVEAPGQVARALAKTWALCVWSISDSRGQVSVPFRNQIIRRYLIFILALGWEASEIYHGPRDHDPERLEVWRDLFLEELRRHVHDGSIRLDVLRDAFESLDTGKVFVSEGYDWLEEKLFDDRYGKS
jgi:hypothetical protein